MPSNNQVRRRLFPALIGGALAVPLRAATVSNPFLYADLPAIKSGGISKTLVDSAETVAASTLALAETGLRAESSHIEKINGFYYLFNLCWPSGGMRTETVYRASTLTGTYTGQVALKSSGNHDGVAQGSVIQMADSSWMGYLFTDHGTVGHCPWLVPVAWSNNWPIFNGGTAPTSLSRSFEVIR